MKGPQGKCSGECEDAHIVVSLTVVPHFPILQPKVASDIDIAPFELIGLTRCKHLNKPRETRPQKGCQLR